MSNQGGEYTKIIEDLREEIDHAHKWLVHESKELHELKEITSKLESYAHDKYKQGQFSQEHNQKLQKLIHKEDDKVQNFEEKLKHVVKRIIEELPYLSKALHNEDLLKTRESIKQDELKLIELLAPNGIIDKRIKTKDITDYHEAHHLVGDINGATTYLRSIAQRIESIHSEFESKKRILDDYEQKGEAVAHDMYIAKKLTKIFNNLFYGGHSHLHSHSVYDAIVYYKQVPGTQMSYFASHISQNSTPTEIVLSSNDIERINKTIQSEGTESEREALKEFFKTYKKIPLPQRTVFRFIADIIDVLYCNDKGVYQKHTSIPTSFYHKNVPSIDEKKELLKQIFHYHLKQVIDHLYRTDYQVWDKLFLNKGLRMDSSSVGKFGYKIIDITTHMCMEKAHKHI